MNNWGVALLGLRSGAPSRDAMGFLYSPLWVASAHFTLRETIERSSAGCGPKTVCLQGRVLPHICPAWPSGRTRSSPRAARAARRSCALDRRPPLNRFLSLLRPPPAPALSSSMDILDTRARWGAQRGPVLAQGVVRRQGAVHLRRPQCREDVREPDAGDEYAARPPPPQPASRAQLRAAAPRSAAACARRPPPARGAGPHSLTGAALGAPRRGVVRLAPGPHLRVLPGGPAEG